MGSIPPGGFEAKQDAILANDLKTLYAEWPSSHVLDQPFKALTIQGVCLGASMDGESIEGVAQLALSQRNFFFIAEALADGRDLLARIGSEGHAASDRGTDDLRKTRMVLEEIIGFGELYHFTLGVEISQSAEVTHHSPGDAGQNLFQRMILEAGHVAETGLLSMALVDTISAENMQVKVEVEGRAPSLDKRDSARRWIFQSLAAGLILVMALDDIDDDFLDCRHELFVLRHPVTHGNWKSHDKLAIRSKRQNVFCEMGGSLVHPLAAA